MAGAGWVALGAPFDSAAAGDGEERAPQALRDAGLLEGLGARDLGEVAEPLRPAERDALTGILAFESLVRGSEAVANAVAGTIEAGDRPLVLGGDCSFLIGAIAGARRAGLRPGLLFVDGHADYWDGDSSPTGEAADMELAILHGQGPSELAGLAPPPPLRIRRGQRSSDCGRRRWTRTSRPSACACPTRCCSSTCR